MIDAEIGAVFFDLDGLLIDTERLGLESFRETARDHGVTLADSLYLDLVGISARQGMQRFRDSIAVHVDANGFIDDWTARYRQQIETSPALLISGAVSLLDRLQRQAMPMCLVTNSARRDAEWKLACAGIADRFDVMVTVDDVAAGKPHPAIYRHAARRLNVRCETAIALEDSAPGVASALAAGMRVLQITASEADAVPTVATDGPDDCAAQARLTVLPSLHAASRWLLDQNSSQETNPG